MSVYDNRTESYVSIDVPKEYAENEFILSWWSSSHDDVIEESVKAQVWYWYFDISKKLQKVTPKRTIKLWRESDPICSMYNWENVLMYFAQSYATRKGYLDALPSPTTKTCPLCDEKFLDTSVPYPFAKRLGVNNLDFCTPCLNDCLLAQFAKGMRSREDITNYIRDLSTTIQKVPSLRFGESSSDWFGYDRDERTVILKLLKRRPSDTHVKLHFSTWLEALIESGILDEDVRRTSRGIQSVAVDGHKCLSLGERTIDDFLSVNGISHVREPNYPFGNYRADFLIGDTYVEYFGLTGDKAYDEKTKFKREECKKHGLKLLEIYPEDLDSIKSLQRKFKPLLR